MPMSQPFLDCSPSYMCRPRNTKQMCIGEAFVLTGDNMEVLLDYISIRGLYYSIKEKCRQIEERNNIGRTRDLYREIKEMTGSYSSRCGAMNLSTGNVITVTEGKEVKEIWQQYTEEPYRSDPNATNSFNENIL